MRLSTFLVTIFTFFTSHQAFATAACPCGCVHGKLSIIQNNPICPDGPRDLAGVGADCKFTPRGYEPEIDDWFEKCAARWPKEWAKAGHLMPSNTALCGGCND